MVLNQFLLIIDWLTKINFVLNQFLHVDDVTSIWTCRHMNMILYNIWNERHLSPIYAAWD